MPPETMPLETMPPETMPPIWLNCCCCTLPDCIPTLKEPIALGLTAEFDETMPPETMPPETMPPIG